MTDATLIGIDIGTTSVKAVLVEPGGRLRATYGAPYATARPRPGWVEQDPGEWFAHVLAALEGFGRAHDLRGLRGIGFTGQVNTHVFVDARLEPLRPAIVWQDGRAAAEGAALEARVRPQEKLAWFGAPIPIDASHPLSRMAWVARHEPEVWAACAHVLSPKDYCIARLTGAVAADSVASVGLVGAGLAYVEPLIAKLEGARARLPALADPRSVVGAVGAGLPGCGTAVTLGTMDAVAGMLGLGVTRPGEAMYLGGTSEVLGVLSPARVPEPGVIVFPDWAGMTLHAGPTQSGGAALVWLAQMLDRPVGALEALCAGTRIEARSPLFLPHLAGERAPLWDASARGAFAGLGMGTDAAAMALAVMEGVALSARLVLEALERSAAVRPEALCIGGGGARSDRWCQIRADVLGRPLVRGGTAEAAARGAAVCAGISSGALDGLGAAAPGPECRRFEPDPAAAALAETRFALFRALYAQLKPINARLV